MRTGNGTRPRRRFTNQNTTRASSEGGRSTPAMRTIRAVSTPRPPRTTRNAPSASVAVDAQPVADALLGQQHARPRRIVLELAPQHRHVDAQVVRFLEVRFAPDLAQQLPAGDDLAG